VLSRVAPAVMYFFASLPSATDKAAEAARTTSQAPAVLNACRALATGLHAAICGEAKTAIVARARAALIPAIATPANNPPGDATQATLLAALEAFERTQNFRDAVLAAANLGGNSDVAAAVCGALAGAHYSAGAIPTLWRNSLMKQQLIAGIADKLLAQVLVSFSA
jgi:ADP-ribosyl-[dinitrogen reductase] hydrolase